MTQGGHIALCKAGALYLGSAVPLETAVGVEAFQMPCRERYWSALDNNMKVDGIDSSIIMYSSGLLMQYNGDPNNVTWFPIQSLHACAALKAAANVGVDGRPRFVPLDSPEGAASSHASMFCAIMRRTRGIKVLECHVFICKSNEAALTLVQGMTHAFEHREGWMSDDALPPVITSSSLGGSGASGTPIVPANRITSSWGGVHVTNTQPEPPRLALPAPPPAPAPAPAPSPMMQCVPVPAPVQNQVVVPTQYLPALSPMMQCVPVPAPVQNQVVVPTQYFSNWDMFGGQAVMFIPGTPFNPDQCKEKKKKKKKKKEKEERDDSGDEEEVYVLKKPGKKHWDTVIEYTQEPATQRELNGYRQVPEDLVIYAPSQRVQLDDGYYYQDDGRQNYVTEDDFYRGNDAPYLVQQQAYSDRGNPMTRDSVARYQADRDANEYYKAVQEYNRALAQDAAAGGVMLDAASGAGYPVDYLGYPYGGAVPNAYIQMADGLGYYP